MKGLLVLHVQRRIPRYIQRRQPIRRLPIQAAPGQNPNQRGPTRHSHLAGLASSIDSPRPSPAPPQTESGNEHSATSRAVQTSHINDNQPPCVTAVYHRAPTAPVQLCTLRHINTFFVTQATNPTLLINGLIVIDTNNNTMNSPLRKERYTHKSLSYFFSRSSRSGKAKRHTPYQTERGERGLTIRDSAYIHVIIWECKKFQYHRSQTHRTLFCPFRRVEIPSREYASRVTDKRNDTR